MAGKRGGSAGRASGEAPYSEVKWKGETMYQCESCPYNTLDKEDIDRHVRADHGYSQARGGEAAVPPPSTGTNNGA